MTSGVMILTELIKVIVGGFLNSTYKMLYAKVDH